MNNRYEEREELQNAALRPILYSGRKFRWIVLILGIIVLLGAVAYGNQIFNGLGVTGLNNDVFWGIRISD